MSEKRFNLCQDDLGNYEIRYGDKVFHFLWEVAPILNEQQEFIEELEASDEMGWKRAEYFEKKCPKELHNKKMHIKRLEYKVQKFKEMNSKQQTTIEHLKKRVYDFEKRKIIEESEIDEDVIPKIKLLRTELFGEKYE